MFKPLFALLDPFAEPGGVRAPAGPVGTESNLVHCFNRLAVMRDDVGRAEIHSLNRLAVMRDTIGRAEIHCFNRLIVMRT